MGNSIACQEKEWRLIIVEINRMVESSTKASRGRPVQIRQANKENFLFSSSLPRGGSAARRRRGGKKVIVPPFWNFQPWGKKKR